MSRSTPQAASDIPTLSGPALALVAIVLASANFIAVLDMTIANVSVPTISGALGVSASQGTWIITSYSVAEAIVVPLTGWLAARFGAVRVFTTGMLLFGAFSAVCGLSDSLALIVLGRVMQGLTGGVMIPLSQTLLLRVFPKEKAPQAMAIWAMTTLVAPIMGPILGGWLCDSFAWPAIFFINVPLAAIAAPVAMRMLKRFEGEKIKAPIDMVGLVLLVIFVGSLQLMIDLGKEHDWFASTEIVALGVVALIGFATFVIWELGETHPIVDLRVFRHRGFTVSVLILSVGFGAIFGSNVLTPLWLQSYMGYTSTWAGLATAWSGVLAVVAAPFAGLLMSKVDPRRLIFLGLVGLALVSIARTGATTDMGYWQIAYPLIAMGACLPMFFVPLTAVALGSVEEHETASASGLQNFMRTLSGALATSLVTTQWDEKTAAAHADFAGVADRSGEAMRILTSAGTVETARAQLDRLVQSQSVMVATNQLMLAMAITFALAAVMVWAAPRPARAVGMGAGH